MGRWSNIEELEESLTLEELELIVKASREKEYRLMRFYAAFKGVDLEEDEKKEREEAFERAQRRANAKLAGKSGDEIDRELDIAEFGDFGLEVEI